MKVILNIKKRYAYFIIGLLVLAVGVFVVNALTPGVAPNPGHTIDTVSPPTGCGDGQVLQFIDETSGWGCVGLPVGTDTDTRCDISGQCSQVCIGSDCQSDWPSGSSDDFIAGNWLIARSPSTSISSTAWVKLKEFVVNRDGVVRTRIKIQVNDNRLYAEVRGGSGGTVREAITGQTLYFNEDISVNSGDTLEFWARMASGGSGSTQLAIGVDNPLSDISIESITDYD